MTTKEKPQTLSEALAIFQSKVKSADRTGTAKETRRDKQGKSNTTERKYSTLEDVLKALQPATELGIAHTQTFDVIPLESGQTLTVCITTLYFKDEKMESVDVLPPIPESVKATNRSQDDGIRRTYTKKYALAAIYGIGSDEDDDANSLTPPPEKEKGTSRTPTKANQKLAPVSEQAKKNPPITTDARNLIMDQLKELNKSNPDEYKKIALSFIQEFKVPKLTGYISEARHGEFLSHAISKLEETNG